MVVVYYVEGSETFFAGINFGRRIFFATFSTFEGFNAFEF